MWWNKMRKRINKKKLGTNGYSNGGKIKESYVESTETNWLSLTTKFFGIKKMMVAFKKKIRREELMENIDRHTGDVNNT